MAAGSSSPSTSEVSAAREAGDHGRAVVLLHLGRRIAEHGRVVLAGDLDGDRFDGGVPIAVDHRVGEAVGDRLALVEVLEGTRSVIGIAAAVGGHGDQRAGGEQDRPTADRGALDLDHGQVALPQREVEVVVEHGAGGGTVLVGGGLIGTGDDRDGLVVEGQIFNAA
ncbi:hypothetical protein LVO79_18250 (plasmid) [Roseivivax marinus]|nr:hypothetical protein [Roseivivax marinus]UMA66975.1 hypothetical protein LVO79_18250 [Roseivivax marinus]